MFRRIRHIIIKEFIQVWRDKKLRFFLIAPPMVQLIAYGYVINFDIKRVAVGIYDECRTPESRDLIKRFRSTDWFHVKKYLDSERQLVNDIDHGEITMVLRVPYDFARYLRQGKKAQVQVILDATDSNAALVVARYAGTIFNEFTEVQLRERLQSQGAKFISDIPALGLEPRAFYNPNLISRHSMIPGVIAMVTLLISLMLTALAVVREKEIGTMEQILVTPIRPIEFLLGKTIPFIIFTLADVVLVTLVGIFWFEVPFRGHVLVLLVGIMCFLFNSVGLGLLISTLASTQQQAMMAGNFFLTPAILLSGLIFPIANMPAFFQYLTYFNPLMYFIIVVQGIFLKGAGLRLLWPQMAAMAGLGAAMLSMAVLRFRRHVA